MSTQRAHWHLSSVSIRFRMQSQQKGYASSHSEGDSDDDDEQPGQKRGRKSDNLLDIPDRKEKHKVVEQKRREKTKELLAELQDLLPNTDDSKSSNLTMNTVLQCAIDFLTSRAADGGQDDGGGEDGGMHDIDVAYRSGFMMASMGIAYTGVDGTILEVNPAFASMLGYGTDQRHKLIGRTLFSLTTPQDIQNTLKAVSRLLSGELTHTSLTEHCVREDGTQGFYSVEMTCLWKNNKAHCIVCFMRPADEVTEQRPAAAGGIPDAQSGFMAGVMPNFNMPDVAGMQGLQGMPGMLGLGMQGQSQGMNPQLHGRHGMGGM